MINQRPSEYKWTKKKKNSGTLDNDQQVSKIISNFSKASSAKLIVTNLNLIFTLGKSCRDNIGIDME